jgi:hypothetical protein
MPCLVNAPADLVSEVARLAEDPGAALIATLESTPGLTTQRVEELLEANMDPAIQEKVLPWYVATANLSAEELLDFVQRSSVTDEAARMTLTDSVREAIRAERLDHAWLLASADEDLSESRHAVIMHYAKKDPYVATQLAEATGGWSDPDLIAGIVGKWSVSDPAQAAMWLDSHSENSGSLTKAHASIAEIWSSADTYHASEWVALLRPGPNRDAAIGGMVKNLAGNDPDAARAWADSIEDEALREQQIQFLEEFPRK